MQNSTAGCRRVTRQQTLAAGAGHHARRARCGRAGWAAGLCAPMAAMAMPELPPHYPTPEQQRAYRAALSSLKQLQEDYRDVHGEPLTSFQSDVPPAPHESTLLERERAVHEAERITLQMTRHWRQLRARERSIRAASPGVGRPVSPPAAAPRADACDTEPGSASPPQESAALPDAVAARANPYLAPATRRAAVKDAENRSSEQWRAVLEDTEARLGSEIDALATRNSQLEQQVQALAQALRLAKLESCEDAVEIVARAFADAAAPSVEAWRETVAETEERLSLDIDVLRENNVELLRQLEMARKQLLDRERGGGARQTGSEAEIACTATVKEQFRESDYHAPESEGLEPGPEAEPEPTLEQVKPRVPGRGHHTPLNVGGVKTALRCAASSAQQASPETAARGAAAASQLPFVDLEEEQLRAQNRQLEDELVAATCNAQRTDVAMNELRARETAVSLREASVAERERIVEHAAAQAMRELASVRERARRLSLLEGDTRA